MMKTMFTTSARVGVVRLYRTTAGRSAHARGLTTATTTTSALGRTSAVCAAWSNRRRTDDDDDDDDMRRRARTRTTMNVTSGREFHTMSNVRGILVRTFASSKKNKAGKGDAVDDDDDDDDELDEDFDVEEEVTMEEFEDDGSGTHIDTAGTSYGELALKCLQEVLDSAEFHGQYEIFSLKVNESRRRVLVSIDKVEDKFGSPTLDELTSIVRAHNALLELKGFPDDVAVETASPGATRNLRLPRELARFSELTMRVTYKGTAEDPGASGDVTKVVDIDEIDDSEVVFKLADVDENRPAKKGQGMNKKSREWRLRMPLDAVVRANLFIDI